MVPLEVGPLIMQIYKEVWFAVILGGVREETEIYLSARSP